VCVSANHLGYPEAGGQMWVYLNWCLGFKELGGRVFWMERVPENHGAFPANGLTRLRATLNRFGLDDGIALWTKPGEAFPRELSSAYLSLEDVSCAADLLVDLRYGTPPEVVSRFRRSALIDIDPGLLQTWVADGDFSLSPHSHYFTIGETVGQAGSSIPDLGLKWHYTPPPISLNWWHPTPVDSSAPFTTVSHWVSKDWLKAGEQYYSNEKRTGFQPFLDLPRLTSERLELAIPLREQDASEREMLEQKGWRVRASLEVSSTAEDFQKYVQGSRGEFSCAKPSYVRDQTAWISDRTLCYLASGKPAIVQHTGPSRVLPDAAGLFRFQDLSQAARHLNAVGADYENACRQARNLAEEIFDARIVLKSLLERAL
jgi:hypothetical protein